MLDTKNTLVGIMFFVVAFNAMGSQVQTDRYTIITPKPTADELDPLSVNVELTFPPGVITVGDALKHVLDKSGWVLALAQSNDAALQITMDRPLPQVHRKMSLMPLRTVLQVLVGKHYVPVEDPLRRIYTFDLEYNMRGLVNHD